MSYMLMSSTEFATSPDVTFLETGFLAGAKAAGDDSELESALDTLNRLDTVVSQNTFDEGDQRVIVDMVEEITQYIVWAFEKKAEREAQ